MDNDTNEDRAADLIDGLDDLDERLDIRDEMDTLSDRIEEIRSEMIHPRAVRMVLEQAGISEEQAMDLIETMQAVDRQTHVDDPS